MPVLYENSTILSDYIECIISIIYKRKFLSDLTGFQNLLGQVLQIGTIKNQR